jgi:ABC-type branched-subunit amino acid transport system substrate-binding protein
VACVLAVVAGACGGDDDDKGSSGAPSTTAALPAGDPIKLSVFVPVDGITAQPELLSGAEAAVDAINAEGGVTDPADGSKRPLELVVCKLKATDDPEAVPLKCAKDAIAAGVVASASKYSFSAQATKAFAEEGIPMIGVIGVTADDYFSEGIFMLSGGAAGTGGSAAAMQAAGAKTIALISADNPGGRFLPGFIKPVLENETDLVNETYLPLDPSVDVAPFVARVMRANPDGIAIAQSTELTIKLVSSLRQGGYEGKIGVPGLSPRAIETLGADAEGLIGVGSYEAPTNTKNPRIKQFVAEMNAHDKDAAKDEFSINAWVSVHFIAEQLEKLPKIDAASLLAAMKAAPMVDLGLAPPFKVGNGNTYLKLPNVPRVTVQYQEVKDGEIVRTGDFVDLDELAKK